MSAEQSTPVAHGPHGSSPGAGARSPGGAPGSAPSPRGRGRSSGGGGARHGGGGRRGAAPATDGAESFKYERGSATPPAEGGRGRGAAANGVNGTHGAVNGTASPAPSSSSSSSSSNSGTSSSAVAAPVTPVPAATPTAVPEAVDEAPMPADLVGGVGGLHLSGGLDGLVMPVAPEPYSGVVRLAVGGRLFDVSPQNLLKFPQSRFAAIMRGEMLPTQAGEYYFDRDPLVFEVLVGFLRTGKIFRPSFISEEQVKEEAAHFGVYADMYPGVANVRFRKAFSMRLMLNGRRLVFSLLPHETLRINSISGSRGVLRMDVVSFDGVTEAKDVFVYDLAMASFLAAPRPSNLQQSLKGGRVYEFFASHPGATAFAPGDIGSDALVLDMEILYDFEPRDHLLHDA